MTVINHKSISGITSITAPAGSDNLFTVHTNDTTERFRIDASGHQNISGIITAANFKTGTSNLHNTGLNIQDLDVDGHTNLDNVSISGVSTFTGAIDANGDLDVDGHTNLDNVSIAGVTTITGASGTLLQVSHTAGSGGQGIIRTKATNANSSSFIRAEDSGSTYIGLLKYGTGHSAYGALGAGDGALYANSGGGNDTNITIMADSSTGYINFATGGNTERLRITSTGIINIGAASASGHLAVNYGQVGVFGGMYYNGSAWVRTATSGRASAGMYVNTGGHIAFVRAAETSGTTATMVESLRIKSTGEVHISDRNSASAGEHVLQAGAFGIRMQDTGGYNRWNIERNYGGWQSDPIVHLSAQGRVGINQASPGSALNVKALGSASDGLQVTSSGHSSYVWQIQNNDNLFNGSLAGELGIRGSSGISFSANAGSSCAVRITSGGQVQLPVNGQELAWGASQQFRMFWENSESRQYLKTTGAYGLAFRINNGNRIEINGTSGDVTMQGSSGRNFNWDNSDASLYLTDNGSGASARLKIGTGGDLQLYHDVDTTNHITCANNHHLKVSAQSFQVYNYSGVTQYFRVKSGDDRVRVYGESAVDGTSSGADGLSIAVNGGTSCPLYFGTETDVAQKSMYLKGYWIYLRGHVNEGHKMIFSQGGAAPHGNIYEFKYNSAKRPGNSTTWDGFSDARAKENVQTITNGISKIKQLRPVTYDWTDEYADSTGMWKMDKSDPKEYKWVSKKENGYDIDAKTGQYGFLAQEYETVLPKDVKQDKFTLGDKELTDFRTINHDSLIPTLTAALKEAIAKIETLETKVAALESS